MFSRIRNAVNALIDSLIGFKADVDETRKLWREQFNLDAAPAVDDETPKLRSRSK